MSTLTVGSIHSETARMDIHELVRQLNTHLGPTLVAALVGSKDRKAPIRWARHDGPEPRPETAGRLMLAHRAWTHIVVAENEHVARAWFIGGNPFLGEATPITAIREGSGREVMAAVRALLEDRQDV